MKHNHCKASALAALFFLMSVVYPATALSEKVPIIASIFPVADMVQQVGSPYVDVTFIIPAGASPHTFEPKPSQIKKIAAARVFFTIGAGLEIWAEKFTAAAGKDLMTVTLSDGITLIGSTESAHAHEDDHDAPSVREPTEPGHAADNAAMANPHIWLDPVIARSMVARIVAILCSVDGVHADHYRRQGEIYLNSLTALDREIRSAVSGFTLKKYVAFHAAWDYFAMRYGLVPAGVIESAPGRNPTPKRIRQIIADIKKYHIRAVFAEPQLNPKVAEVIAKEAGVRVLLLDPMGAPALTGRSSYLELMRYNLDVLKEAMQ